MRGGVAVVVVAASACGGMTSAVDAPAGANTIQGMVDGSPFATAAASFWIGAPDSPASDTVVYVFDRPVPCSAIVDAGWDSALTPGTKILELKEVGMDSATYPNTPAATHIPAPGESFSSYTVAAPSASDLGATGGSVTLSALGSAAGGFASGAFDLTFAGGSLAGTFDATFCAAGREP